MDINPLAADGKGNSPQLSTALAKYLMQNTSDANPKAYSY